MAHELISRKTRLELREYFVSTSLSIIANEFDSADVPFSPQYEPNVSGQRRGMVEQYYHAIDWTRWADVRKFLNVYENVLSELEDHAENDQEWAAKALKSLRRWIERDGFKYTNGKLDRTDSRPGLTHIADAAGALDLPELHRQIQRLQSSLEHDPGLAIGTAKELVETVCKTILEERSLAYGDSADIGSLVKEARKALGLVPESIPNAARGAESIRRLLSNLGSVAQSLGELRNLYGTGHGKAGAAKGLLPRHARLAVGSAATLATFLLETHTERGI
jgi:hypothetical protein